MSWEINKQRSRTRLDKQCTKIVLNRFDNSAQDCTNEVQRDRMGKVQSIGRDEMHISEDSMHGM